MHEKVVSFEMSFKKAFISYLAPQQFMNMMTLLQIYVFSWVFMIDFSQNR